MEEQRAIGQTVQLPAKKKKYWLSRLGLVLACMPLLGVLWLVFSMSSYFGEAGSTSAESLANRVSTSLEFFLAFNTIGLAGFLLLFWGLFVSRNRELWFYSNAQTISIIMCIFWFPFWMIVGLPLLICLRHRKQEFPQKGTLKSFRLQ